MSASSLQILLRNGAFLTQRPPACRPEEFFKGAAAGSISLVKNSAYGVFNFMSLLMGSVSKGLAVLSMDDDFVQRFSERPANTQEAFIQGAQVRQGDGDRWSTPKIWALQMLLVLEKNLVQVGCIASQALSMPKMSCMRSSKCTPIVIHNGLKNSRY